MKRIKAYLAAALLASSAFGQMTAAKLLQPTPDSWPMYNGDYSGRRFSSLKKINDQNIGSLSLAWVYRITAPGGIKATPLVVDGIMYFTVPDHVWAIDARTGREIWHYTWQSKGGIHIGNRGVGIYGKWLYFETPDCNLVSLNLKDGKERWHKPICELDQMYFGSTAPLIVKNHVIVGVSGDDLDVPGYIQSHNPETGDMEWRWYAHPQPGEPEAKSWPSVEAMLHGGGMVWGSTTYDPDLNLIYFGTGNPQPVIAGKGRIGDNLYTESIVALDADTGKMKWYFQTTPWDVHDWDAVEIPILVDAPYKETNRKLLVQANRNGFYYVLDRATGEFLSGTPYIEQGWAEGLDPAGRPILRPNIEPTAEGTVLTPNLHGGTNWYSPSYSPRAGLFYVAARQMGSTYFKYDVSYKPGSYFMGGGESEFGGDSAQGAVKALNPLTGAVRWSFPLHSPPWTGLLSTGGGLVFGGTNEGVFFALSAVTGSPLWHFQMGAQLNANPIAFAVDGRQYVAMAAGGTLQVFALAGP